MTDWKKRAGELGLPSWVRTGPERGSHYPDAVELALQLGQEMADARAEEIAQAIEGYKLLGCMGCPYQSAAKDAAQIARLTIKSQQKKTREEVLEEALKEIALGYRDSEWHNKETPRLVGLARRALEEAERLPD